MSAILRGIPAVIQVFQRNMTAFVSRADRQLGMGVPRVPGISLSARSRLCSCLLQELCRGLDPNDGSG
jgi:hypothetical protein